MFNRGELKFQARQQLRGEYWPALLVSMITFFLVNVYQPDTHIPYTLYGILLFLMSRLFNLHGIIILSIFTIVLYFFVGGPILMGRSRYFINSIRKQWNVMDLFLPFRKKSYWNVTIVMLVFGLVLASGPLIFLLFLWLLLRAGWPYALVMVIYVCASVTTFLLLLYKFRFVPYVLAEYPKMKRTDVFNLAFDLSEDRKIDLFTFDFSFAGWYLLGGLLFGVGIFFVMPYHELSVAKLYLELKAQKDNPKKEPSYMEEYWATPRDKKLVPEDNWATSYNKKLVPVNSRRLSFSHKGMLLLLLSCFMIGSMSGIGSFFSKAATNPLHIKYHQYAHTSVAFEDEELEEYSIEDEYFNYSENDEQDEELEDIRVEDQEPEEGLINGQRVTTFQCLQNAIAARANLIIIEGDIILEQTILIISDTTITGTGTLYVAGPFRHFTVREHATLTMEGNLTLSGRGYYTNHFGGGVWIIGGTFVLLDGEISNIKPYTWTDREGERHYHGGISVQHQGTFYMYNGLIHDSDRHGVLVTNDSAFNMFGGRINFIHGSGVMIHDGATFNMYGGEISRSREGGIYVYIDGELNLKDGLITNNTGGLILNGSVGNMYGGVIKENGSNGVRLSGRGSIFNFHDGLITRNTAGSGGGVYLGHSLTFANVFNMYGGVISYNEAQVSGGGVYIHLSQMNLFGGEIVNNTTAIESSHHFWFSGGGIEVNSGWLIMHDGLIKGNASYRGGGVSTQGLGPRTLGSRVAIRGGQILENRAYYGGGIYLLTFSSLAIGGVEIRGNVAYRSGGGLYGSRNRNDFTIGPDVVFSENVAYSSHNLGLAAGRERYPHIMWDGENSLPGTHLFNNYDVSFEGRWSPAIWQIHLIIVGLVVLIMIISGVIFHKKKEVKMATGGLLLLFFLCFPVHNVVAMEEVVVIDESSLRKAVTTSDSTIVVNDVIVIRDVIEIDTSVTITGSGTLKVANNHRHFQVNSSGVLTLEGNLILTQVDEYTGYGGGIEVKGRFYMNGGTIVGNRSTATGFNLSGGGVHVSGGSFYMNHGVISNNFARRGAGGVFSTGSFCMNGGVISENHGNSGGGVFAGVGGDFRMNGGLIYNNNAFNGGGVYLNGATMSMTGGEIRGNTATAKGGGIFVYRSRGNRTTLTIHGGRIIENFAYMMGGGLALEGSPVARLMGGELSHNTATGHGGIYYTFLTTLSTGNNMRIRNNHPVNAYDSTTLHSRLITPNIFGFAIIFAIAGIGTYFSIKKRLGN